MRKKTNDFSFLLEISKNQAPKDLMFRRYGRTNVKKLGEKNEIKGVALTYLNLKVGRFERLKNGEALAQRLKHALMTIPKNSKAKRVKNLVGRAYKAAKVRDLSVITLSALFYGVRRLANIKAYVPLIQIDFDKLSPTGIIEVEAVLSKTPFVLSYFRSVGKTGVKAIAALDMGATAEQHKQYFEYIRRYFLACGCEMDASTKDITRAFFLPYSEYIYINNELAPLSLSKEHTDVHGVFGKVRKPSAQKSLVLPIEQPTNQSQHGSVTSASSEARKLDLCEQLVKIPFKDGYKHNHACSFALFANKMGVPLGVCESYYYSKFDKQPCNAFSYEYGQNPQHYNTFVYTQTSVAQTPPKLDTPPPYVYAYDSEDIDPLPILGVAPPTPIAIEAESPTVTRLDTTKGLPSFPLDTIPSEVRAYCKVLNEYNRIPIEYTAPVFLTAAAGVIGNSYVIGFGPHWVEPALLFTCLVGLSSAKKTPAIRTMTAPVSQKQAVYTKRYDNELAAYEAAKEAKETSYTNGPNKRPHKQRVHVSDTTLEKLIQVLSQNPNGLLLEKDEFVSFIAAMSRYSNTSELHNWLSIWSRSLVDLMRLGREDNAVEFPNVSIIGGTQYSALQDIASGRNSTNGLIFRILWSLSPKREMGVVRAGTPDNGKEAAAYFELFEKLFALVRKKPLTLKLVPSAVALYEQHQQDVSNKAALGQSEYLDSLYGKLNAYVLRFALIIQVCECASKGIDPVVVTLASVQKAIRIVEYFEINALRVKRVIDTSGIDEKKLQIVEMLRDGIANKVIAQRLKVSRATVSKTKKKYQYLIV